MLIGIDMLGVQSSEGRRESGRIGRQLVEALLARDSTHRYVLYAHDGRPTDQVPSSRNALRITLGPGQVRRVRDQNPDGLDWLILLDPFLEDGRRSASAPIDGMKLASVVVDLAPNRIDDRRLAPLKHHEAILAFSGPTAAECRKRLGPAADRVTTLGLACEAATTSIDDLQHLGITGPFLLANLAEGAEQANLPGILEAYARLPIEQRDRHQLAIAGTVDDPWGVITTLLKRGCAEGLVLLGEVEERNLHSLYRQCSAFVAPAISEGSGFSLVEAMCQGAVVVAGWSGNQPEIVGEGGWLVDPSNPAEIADRIGMLLSDEALRCELRERAKARSSRFSWGPVVDQVLEVLENSDLPPTGPRLRFDQPEGKKSERPSRTIRRRSAEMSDA